MFKISACSSVTSRLAFPNGFGSLRVHGVVTLAHNTTLGGALPKHPDRKTSIICTVGPSSWHRDGLRQLLANGMNVMRLNFSHGTHDQKVGVIDELRSLLSKNRNTPALDFHNGSRDDVCAIAADTKGPEIRTGLFANDATSVELKAGDSLVLSTDPALREGGTVAMVFVDYQALAEEVKPGQRIWVDDGLLGLEVIGTECSKGHVQCLVLNDASLGQQKGVNIPFPFVSNLPAVTAQDARDLKFAAAVGVDYVFASFIRNAADVESVRAALNNNRIKIVSKIENQEGCAHFDKILEVSDGIMVARGDLGIEVPAQQVTLLQKAMIAKCNLAGKPVICATQMLESMVQNPRPTRAEVSDVANAVFDGADAVMLSGETAKGKWPNESVQIMSSVCREAEAAIDYESHFRELRQIAKRSRVGPRRNWIPAVEEAIATSAVVCARELGAVAIIVLSMTGRTVRAVAKYRPACPIIAVTFDESVANSLVIHRGVIPLILPASMAQNPDSALDAVVEEVERMGIRSPFERRSKMLVALKVGQSAGQGVFAGAANSVNDTNMSSMASVSSVSSLHEPQYRGATRPHLTIV